MTLAIEWTDVLTVDGTASNETPAELLTVILSALDGHRGPVELHLYGLDLDTGPATVTWHQVTRLLRDRQGSVVLVDAPQMLAHSLYKVGDLSDGRIRLVDPRSDEGITVN
jgi:hypothetical protein